MAADGRARGARVFTRSAHAFTGATHVFTYGTLMFPAVWSKVVTAGPYRQVAARLPGYRRRRVRGADYPAIEQIREAPPGPAGVEGTPAIDGSPAVDGLLYLDVAPADLVALDAFEGEDYRRIEATVIVKKGLAGGPQAGARLRANTYLFVAAGKLEAGDWDPGEFERDRIERFLRE